MQMLVVDDDVELRDVIAACLRSHGHSVLLADSADDAIAAVDRHGMPEAVVLETGSDGDTLLHRLRQRVPNLPALVLTGLRNPADLARITSGRVGCLAKPFTGAELFRAVGKLSAAVA
ncbi:response regulator [Krasilnikovia sp. M28-CT-15]|uniref:response regulator n=1 Tax=Krasilnikovia sp. M28-CT-15 TaxID=3373540 RepID=UPI00387611B1